MNKIIAYLRKSYQNARSYRLAFLLGILLPVLSVVIFFFIDKLFGYLITPYLAPFGVNYFSYVLVGIMSAGFLGGSLTAVSRQVTQEQMMGTLESILVTPTGIYTLLGAMMLWNLLSALIDIVIYLTAGIFIFKVNFGNANLLSTAVIVILALVSFNALGILAASFVLALKRGDPVSYLMNLGMEILGGIFFPITVLPGWLQTLSYLFPITYAVQALEKAVYQNASLDSLKMEVWMLILFSTLLLPLAYWSIKTALNYARRRGTLVQY